MGDEQYGHPRFYDLVEVMRQTHAAKNQDYADAKTDPLRNFRACAALGEAAPTEETDNG